MKRRDIALAAALLPFASIFAGSTAFAADAGNLKKLRVGVCLLYTSDAADD